LAQRIKKEVFALRSMNSSRDLLLTCFAAALRAVDARRCVHESLRQRPPGGRWHLIGVGKAAAAMAMGARDALGADLTTALVIVPREHTPPDFPRDQPGWVRIESAHPLPDATSIAAGETLVAHVASLPRRANVLCVVSGGASSLVELPRAGLTLEDIQCVNRWALASGASISTINAVRRRLSRLKGGGLATILGDRRVLALMISDVPRDDPGTIGSGLLHATPRNASPASDEVVRAITTAEVQDILRRAMDAQPPADRVRRVTTRVVATSRVACEEALRVAREDGHRVVHSHLRFAGEAKTLGEIFVAKLARLPSGTVFAQGGESTVTLPAIVGRGGRNQHLALSAAIALERKPESKIVLLSAGTDGIDGATTDAGAVVDSGTCNRGRDAGFDPQHSLAAADSGTFLDAAGDLVHTGATLTNVGDLVLGVNGGG
jgi:hydroxypyruvate reductase